MDGENLFLELFPPFKIVSALYQSMQTWKKDLHN